MRRSHSASLESRGLRTDRLLNDLDRGRQQAWRSQSVVSLARLFRDLCDRLEVVSLIECGAYEASTSRSFRAGHSDRVAVAMEANPLTVREITGKAAEDGVIVLAEAAGRSAGSMTLLIPENNPGTMASPLRQVKDRGRIVDELVVPVTTLDEVARRHALAGPIALWIDTEGTSLEVLLGATAVLDLTAVIMIELQAAPIWDGQSEPSEVHTLLAAHGFELAARDFQVGERLYNGVFVRDDDERVTELCSDYWDAVLERPRLLTSRANFWRGLLAARALAQRGRHRMGAGAR